jgi:LemA protein
MSKVGQRIALVVIVLVVVIAIGFGWFKSNYNRIVGLDEEVSKGWAQVETVLQRRLDLIPNLVNTVKGYASHEEEVLTAVTQARSRVGSAQSVGDKAAANGELNSALSRLMVVMENYPQLKADQGFLGLQAQLEGTENRISVERQRYNEAVATYNKSIRQIPGTFFAAMFGFEKKVPFEAAQQAQSAPSVQF